MTAADIFYVGGALLFSIYFAVTGAMVVKKLNELEEE